MQLLIFANEMKGMHNMTIDVCTRRTNTMIEMDTATEVADNCTALAEAITNIFADRLCTVEAKNNYVIVTDDDTIHEIMVTAAGLCILRTSVGSINNNNVVYNMAENWHTAIFMLGEIMSYTEEQIVENYEQYM